MAVKTLTINNQLITASENQTILEAAKEVGISIPTLCHLNYNRLVLLRYKRE